jgi:hypothetical protein
VTDKGELARPLVAQMKATGLELADLSAVMDGEADAGGPTVAEFILSLVHSSKYAPRTIDTYQPYWRLLIELFGDRRLNSISPSECEAVVEAAFRRAKARFPDRSCRSSKESCVGALRAVFGPAKRLGLIETNPDGDPASSRPRSRPTRANDANTTPRSRNHPRSSSSVPTTPSPSRSPSDGTPQVTPWA